MCFSAGASFAASAFLALIGSYTVAKNYSSKKLWMIGAIPLLFAIQQASEGVLWLALTQRLDSFYIPYATYFFLFFALILWPLWIPNAVYRYQAPQVRNYLYIPIIAGFITALYLMYYVYVYGAYATITHHHIEYVYGDGMFDTVIAALYMIATIAPFFMVRSRSMQAFGVVLALSALISALVWKYAFTSIWCFFAAVLSLFVVAIVRR